MVKPVIRNKSVGTKVTEEEYARLEDLAGGRSMGEWVREVLLKALEPSSAPSSAAAADEALMAELLALRVVMMNLLFRLANGEKITEAEMRQLIERADADKRKKAAERLRP